MFFEHETLIHQSSGNVYNNIVKTLVIIFFGFIARIPINLLHYSLFNIPQTEITDKSKHLFRTIPPFDKDDKKNPTHSIKSLYKTAFPKSPSSDSQSATLLLNPHQVPSTLSDICSAGTLPAGAIKLNDSSVITPGELAARAPDFCPRQMQVARSVEIYLPRPLYNCCVPFPTVQPGEKEIFGKKGRRERGSVCVGK